MSGLCRICGASLQDGARFCALCGADVGGLPNPDGRQLEAGPLPRKGISGDLGSAGALTLTVVCNGEVLSEASLAAASRLTFGTHGDNDIVVPDPTKTMSRHHGAFVFSGGSCKVVNERSTNGLFANGVRFESMDVEPGDVITVGKPDAHRESIVLLVGRDDMEWSSFDLSRRREVSVGRTAENDLMLPFSAVSARHVRLQCDGGGQWVVTDEGSFNGTYVDGAPVIGPRALLSGSSLVVADVPLVYSGQALFFANERVGVDVSAFGLVKRRKVRGQTRVTNDGVSVHIKRGQFVAIAGGSGSGKTTLLNALCGSEPADEGRVLIDGVDLYSNYSKLKNTIGYVPQQDIVYDNLSLADMLDYSARLRMPPDTTPEERALRIDEVVSLLELEGVRNNLISNMSGGQKKRASIAVELLADPRLLFLDEPTSGLDPGIEQHLMKKLAAMAHEGRTIILVTHTTLNLHLCDQVVFLGSGGRLCFAGAPNQALGFFGVEDFVGIYPRISGVPDADRWRAQFDRQRTERLDAPAFSNEGEVRETPGFVKQLATLSSRYAKLLVNDRARLLLLLLQAPLLAALICLVAGEGCFSEYEGTKSCLFALSCAAFWVGVLDAIQEVCKERDIFDREYAGGMKIVAYVLSKCMVLGVLCVVQAFLLTAVFCIFEPPPDDALLFAQGELFVTNFLVTFSAMCLGLLVSSLFNNPDRAIAMAPLLIMPQILFSGLVFKLEGVAEAISLFVHCRWGMEAFGTTANLNALDLGLYGEEIIVPETETTVEEVVTDVPGFDTTISGQAVTVPEQHDMTLEDVQVTVPEDTFTIDGEMYPHDFEGMFEYTLSHLVTSWGVLVAFSVICMVACCIVLRFKVHKGR